MIKTTRSLFLILSHTVTIFYHSVMSCSRQTKVRTDCPSISSWLFVLLLQTEARPRPNVWGRGRDRGRGQNSGLEASRT